MKFGAKEDTKKSDASDEQAKDDTTATQDEVQAAPPKAETKAPVTAIRSGRTLPDSRLELSESAHNSFRIIFPNGTVKEEIETPEFWAHVAAKLRVSDIFDGITEDGTMYFRGIVLGTHRAAAVVKVLEETPLEEYKVEADDPDYKIEHNGPFHKWRIVRKKDGEVISSQHATQRAARQWLDTHLQALAR